MTVTLTPFHYSEAAYTRQRQIVSKCKKALAEVDFDTILVCGTSGLMMGPLLAYLMNRHFVVVRKEGDKDNHGGKVFGICGNRVLFVDDFVSSGKTRRHSLERLAAEMKGSNDDVVYVGTLSYGRGTPHLDESHQPRPLAWFLREEVI